jgi:hypothetical protein
MKLGLRPLELLYLALGTAILGNEIFRTQTLTMTELGASLFFFGLTAASVADREGTTGPLDFLRLIVELVRGGDRNRP